MYYMSKTVLRRKGSGHTIRRNNHDFCSSLSSTLLSVKHSFIIMIGVKPNRVSEARKATWSSSVLEFGIVSV